MSDNPADYDYSLPAELIAHRPAPEREGARLLVVRRRTGALEHRGIRDLPELLGPGDCLALNDTRVVKARLLGRRERTGGRWEGLFLGASADGAWRVLGQTRGKLQPGECITVVRTEAPQSTDVLRLELLARDDDGIWTARPHRSGDWQALLEHFGTVPLPPYMRRNLPDAADIERYQTTYARCPGSVAAPTAGLHFTPELLERCRVRGIDQALVTLHVGIGTFRPIAAESLSAHQMHSEWCEAPAATLARLAQARARGGRVVAVGTTTVRTLESAAAGMLCDKRTAADAGWSGETRLFIRPPYEFRAVDVLLTNFHLPRSTLLVLVAAFAGRNLILRAYAEAIRARYRFYSYGDAMLIV